jgi:hypothetical protein
MLEYIPKELHSKKLGMINTNEERKLSPFSIGEDNKKIKQ